MLKVKTQSTSSERLNFGPRLKSQKSSFSLRIQKENQLFHTSPNETAIYSNDKAL